MVPLSTASCAYPAAGRTRIAATTIDRMTTRDVMDASPYEPAGAIDFSFIPVGNVLGAIREGRLIALATGTEQRSKFLPDVPTTVEAGVPGSSYGPWIGMFAPAATPAAVLDRLNREVVKTLRAPETAQKLSGFGAEAAPMSAEAFDAQVAREVGIIREIVRVAKIPVNN